MTFVMFENYFYLLSIYSSSMILTAHAKILPTNTAPNEKTSENTAPSLNVSPKAVDNTARHMAPKKPNTHCANTNLNFFIIYNVNF